MQPARFRHGPVTRDRRNARSATGDGLKIGIVAGEASGDILGARLMAAIREQRPEARFCGVGGDSMLAEGMELLAPLDALAVNGFKDPLLRLPSLYQLLRKLHRHFVGAGMDVVIGVDFNVFNFMLERRVKRCGIPTAHYVSPAIYFWRPGRVKRIAAAADVVLALYPFEPALYAEGGGHAVFVGHPLADEIDPDDGGEPARRRARQALGIPDDRRVVALLPGSRRSEIDYLGALFLDTAARVREPLEDPVFLIPTPTAAIHEALGTLQASRGDIDVRLIRKQSRTVIAAADVVLAKSGTATLETMLLRRPMVVSYRVGALTAWLIRRLKGTGATPEARRRAEFIALPNILAGRALVPELVQEDAEPARLATALIDQYRRCQADDGYFRTCARWHQELRQGGAGLAARAVLSLVGSG